MSLLLVVASIVQAPVVESPPLLLLEQDQPRLTALDLMVGSPLGLTLRLQRRIDPSPLYVEGYVGTFLFGSGVGVGLRGESNYRLGRCDAVVVRPGVTAYAIALSDFISSSGAAGVFAVDVDLAWQHRYAWGGIGEFGIKVGPGIAVSGHDTELLGIVGLYHGWRF